MEPQITQISLIKIICEISVVASLFLVAAMLGYVTMGKNLRYYSKIFGP